MGGKRQTTQMHALCTLQTCIDMASSNDRLHAREGSSCSWTDLDELGTNLEEERVERVQQVHAAELLACACMTLAALPCMHACAGAVCQPRCMVGPCLIIAHFGEHQHKSFALNM